MKITVSSNTNKLVIVPETDFEKEYLLNLSNTTVHCDPTYSKDGFKHITLEDKNASR